MEAGEEVVVTVAGRPSVRLVPVAPRVWRQWDDVTDLFAGPGDDTWDEDRDRVGHELQDPWAESR